MGEFFNRLTELHGGIPEPLHETTAVLCFEVGRMMEHAMYMKWYPSDVVARRGFYKSELMDALAQIDLICESLGIDFEEYRQMGVEKAMERFGDKAERFAKAKGG